MLNSRNLLSGNGKYLVGAILLLFISTIYAAFWWTDGDDFAIARKEVLLRRIGHELLLQSGDSTSRVLPIKKIAENEYQISFQRALTFQPDSLINTTRRLLVKDPLAGDYVVNVMNSGNSGAAYGFAISKDKKDDIIACVGRKQPKARYIINIKFERTSIHIVKNQYLLGGLPFLAFMGFIFLRSVKPRRVLTDGQHTDIFDWGSLSFDVRNRSLRINGNAIDLTGTETRVLHIFALSPNETVERSRLQKEIWEDEGVIVGRSLDMFISKLRKKLECDSNIKIVVVRGRGYKLNVNI
jgi:DNA-binding winged helix-turn-helix (wHTH) protein